MGNICKKKMNCSEASIQKVLANHFMSPNSLKYQIESLFVYGWESDFLNITKSGYAHEVEIKISRADFLNDFKNKKKKHLILEGNYHPEVPTYADCAVNYNLNENRPNYFYYAVPDGLISVEEVPEYAGLIYITNVYPYFKIVKNAKQIHKDKFDADSANLLDKFYYNYRSWKNKAETEFREEINSLKFQLNESKKVDGKKYKYTLSEAMDCIEELESKIKLKDEYALSLNKKLTRYIDYSQKLEDRLKSTGVKRSDLEEIFRNCL